MSIKELIPRPVKDEIKTWIIRGVKSPMIRHFNCSKFKRIASKVSGPVRLHFGCGPRHLDGWINIDIYPHTPAPDVLIDVEKSLPLKDSTVDFIFTEDLIEHLSLKGGKNLLSECARVLKPGGVLRIGTPDLESFIQAYLQRSQQDFDWYKEHLGTSTFAEMFNAGLRAWGHTFIYDEETLSRLLVERGFSVMRKRFNDTEFNDFRGLDLRSTEDGAHSMFFECVKSTKSINSRSRESVLSSAK